MDKYSYQSSEQDQNRDLLVQSPLQHQNGWVERQSEESGWREFLGLVRRRGFVLLGVSATVMATVFYSTLTHRLEYEGSFRLLVEPLNDEIRLQELAGVQNQNQNVSKLDYASQIQVLKSPELINSIVKQLQGSYPNIDYDAIVKYLTIMRLGETKIIEVRYRNDDRDKIKVVLDRIAQTYLDYSLEKRQTSLRQGLQFVEKHLSSMQKRVDQLQKELQLFRQQYDFVDPESQSREIAEQVSALSQQRLIVNQQLATAQANFKNIQTQEGELATLNQATVYQQLIVQLRQLESHIAMEQTRFLDESPHIQTLKEKRDGILPLLRKEAQRFSDVKVAEVAANVKILEVQSQELARAEQLLEKKRKQLPVLTRQYTEQLRKLQVATESLNRFLTTRETLQIQVAQTELPWQLIQAPVKPEYAVSPDTRRSLILGFIASLALGIGAIVLLDQYDNKYHILHALKQKIKQPLLGAIPFEKHLQSNPNQIGRHRILTEQISDSITRYIPKRTTARDDGNYSAKFVEALRLLYTNIQLLTSDRPIRSIVVSSAMKEDGKSTVAFHLAQIATAMGQRVLLVDADLRSPILHNLSELSNHWGLSNLITTNVPVSEAIQKPAFLNQLSILTAGQIPPDPTKLLSSDKMKQLMADFQKTFDLVIYDAPSIVGLADASLLAPHTDGILMVVRLDKTDRSVFKRGLDSLKMARINILGVVANCQRSHFGSDYEY